MTVTPHNPDQDEQAMAADARLTADLAALNTAHITRSEADDLMAATMSELSRRAIVHSRSCARCLERLAAAIEERVLDEQDDLDIEPDPDGRVDPHPLRRFLRAEEPVVRAAAAQATRALSMDESPFVEDLQHLVADADPLVSATAAAALQDLMPRGVPAVVQKAKRALMGIVEPFTVSFPLLGRFGHAAGRLESDAPPPNAEASWQSVHDGPLTVRVRYLSGQLHVEMSTTDPEIGAATVRFVLLDSQSGEEARANVIQIRLGKLAGEQRWMATWIGPSGSCDRVSVREVEPNP
jgi:hypothetical protein